MDDEDDVRELIKRLLLERGADVVAVGSAAEAMSELARYRPDVLVSDISMPEQDGYDLVRSVRALPADRGGLTPAVALTAFARPSDKTTALEAGYQRHITKPIDPAELFSVVASLAGRA